jgi:hypothetical protein
VLEVDESFWLALLLYGIWNAMDGTLEDAFPLAEKAFAIAPYIPGSVGLLAGVLSRNGDTGRSEHLIQGLGDGTAYGAPLGFLVFHEVRMEPERMAYWVEKAIEQRDPNILPATSEPSRKYYVASGHWPRLARLLRLPGPDGGITAALASGQEDGNS